MAAVLAGCAATTPTREMSSGYVIIDIRGGQEIGHARIAEAVRTALQTNTTAVRINNAIPPSPLPEKAPRFQLVSPLKGSALGALAASSGQILQVPTCEGAILVANATDTSKARYGESTTFFACVMPYVGGWSLNIYTTFDKASGAFNAATLGATLARTVVGDSSRFIPRTIGSMVEALNATGAKATVVESYP